MCIEKSWEGFFGLFCFSELVAPRKAVRAETEGSQQETRRAELCVEGWRWATTSGNCSGCWHYSFQRAVPYSALFDALHDITS